MSTLKVNKIRDTAGSADAIVLDPSGGVKMSGICTATTFDGAATSLTQIPAANIVGVCTSGLTKTGGFGGGKILQVVQTVKKNRTTLSSQTLVDISGMSVSITPSSASNKVLVNYSLMVFSNAQYWTMRLVRGSDSTIFIGDQNASATSQTRGSFGSYQSSYVSAETVVQSFLDSPNTTSETTYKLQAGHPYSSSYTLGINASAAVENGNYMTAGVSTITVMEVAV
tara:strand:- start:26 stop:703 length:678 start_codon:yes stop_codon:yes gene_type:complete